MSNTEVSGIDDGSEMVGHAVQGGYETTISQRLEPNQEVCPIRACVKMIQNGLIGSSVLGVYASHSRQSVSYSQRNNSLHHGHGAAPRRF